MSAALSIFDGSAEQLQQLAEAANEHATQVEKAGQDMVAHAIASGNDLLAAKKLVDRGDWLPWLEKNWERTERLAQIYIELAEFDQSEKLNTKTSSYLTLSEAGSIEEARKMIKEACKPTHREMVLEAIREAGPAGITDRQVIEQTGLTDSSVRGRRGELCKQGLVKAGRKIKIDGSSRAQTRWIAVAEDEEEKERAKKAQERREHEKKIEKTAQTILKMKPATRAAVMRRLYEDPAIRQAKMRGIAADQRRGDGTQKDHVKTCLVESFHRLSSAVQQNGPGTSKRWFSQCSDTEKQELRTFAANLRGLAETLDAYLNKEL